MTEKDPNGKSAHEPGSKLDAGKVRVGLMVTDFADAIFEVAKVSTFGANKYTPRGWRTVPNGIERYHDALNRHLLHPVGALDDDSQLYHLAHAAWNALAVLQLYIDEQRNRDDRQIEINFEKAIGESTGHAPINEPTRERDVCGYCGSDQHVDIECGYHG